MTKPLDSTPATRVVGYIRASTDEQQNTLVAQRTQIEAYCAFKPGFELLECFVDEGESAVERDFHERPVALRMLAWMAEHGATAIVITKLDRGFRGAVDLLLTLQHFRERGIGVHLLDIGLDPTNPVGEMVATIMAAIARFECRRKSERVKDAFQVMRATRQRTGAVPYGWNAAPSHRISKTGRAADDLVVNEYEMVWLHLIVQWAQDGLTDGEIARRLNASGVKTKQAGRPMRRKSRTWVCDGRWTAAHVLNVRRNPNLVPVSPLATGLVNA